MNKEESQFTKKTVDESWKETVNKEKVEPKPAPASPQAKESQEFPVSFSAFITSLGIQTLIRMGDYKDPRLGEVETDLDSAKETIDLLLMLKEKTKGNLTKDEERLINSLIPELQLKYVQHTTA